MNKYKRGDIIISGVELFLVYVVNNNTYTMGHITGTHSIIFEYNRNMVDTLTELYTTILREL